jgi:hypothetical protein
MGSNRLGGYCHPCHSRQKADLPKPEAKVYSKDGPYRVRNEYKSYGIRFDEKPEDLFPSEYGVNKNKYGLDR